MRSLACVLLFLLPLSCGAQDSLSTLRIASDATFAPFHYIDENGLPTGFDIELARAAAIDAGFGAKIIVLPYNELFTGLLAHGHDVVAATTGITEERQSKYLFSDPYYQTCQVAVVRAGQNEPSSLVDLETRTVGASGSGTSRKAMQTIVAHERITLGDGAGINALLTGAVDAWIVDEFDGIAEARASSGRLRILPEPVSLEQYGFVLPPGERDLQDRLNRSLKSLRADGTIARLRIEFGLDRGPEWPVTGCARQEN